MWHQTFSCTDVIVNSGGPARWQGFDEDLLAMLRQQYPGARSLFNVIIMKMKPIVSKTPHIVSSAVIRSAGNAWRILPHQAEYSKAPSASSD